MGFKGKPNDVNTVEIGYGITTSEQRKGYATEAVALIIQWVFQFKNVDKIIAKCHVYNIPSIRVLEKLGMKQIGIDNNFLNWELRKKDLFKSK
ncbi:GNAT family N-acetyltransferase [Caldibacillus thermolactis]|uniref:GNAT family N-acetyltransferase n=1 Tax=Pallidibacillus thermolactis TaxID=251051 RepID=A0ABT2WI31_9BACI|nr:GNAT family N-acetyltransferase [Pallidibacillus thermolactis]MCU9595356.1 GNAT family N-acetyltransferase [Pallidibacillus thermolactis]